MKQNVSKSYCSLSHYLIKSLRKVTYQRARYLSSFKLSLWSSFSPEKVQMPDYFQLGEWSKIEIQQLCLECLISVFTFKAFF